MTVPSENVENWRELVPDLSQVQISALENMERHRSNKGIAPEKVQQELVAKAREFAHGNVVSDVMFVDIAIPPDAGSWSNWHGEGDNWQREFQGRQHDVGAVRVQICGVQRQDGSISRKVRVSGHDELSVVDTRSLAALLLGEAAEIESRTAES